jgi:hypothetical protein
MPETTARVSVAVTAQVRDDGTFPAMATYPASFERYMTSGKVYATSGTLGGSGATLPVGGTLATVKVWFVQNLAESGSGSITVADAPVNATLARGQMLLATNDITGWTAGTVTLSGTAGTPYKVIAIGA